MLHRHKLNIWEFDWCLNQVEASRAVQSHACMSCDLTAGLGRPCDSHHRTP